MPEKATPSDLFMNFISASATLDSSNSSTLVSSEVNTGLSIRGQLAFLIHKVEVMWPSTAAADATCRAAVTTRADLASMPGLSDQGVIWRGDHDHAFAGAAYDNKTDTPYNTSYLPPVPIAAPKIVTYVKTTADVAAYRGQDIEIRLGFTTVKIDSKLYMELAEVWGFSE